MWDYSDGIKEQTEERRNAALGDRPNLILMFHSGFSRFMGCTIGDAPSHLPITISLHIFLQRFLQIYTSSVPRCRLIGPILFLLLCTLSFLSQLPEPLKMFMQQTNCLCLSLWNSDLSPGYCHSLGARAGSQPRGPAQLYLTQPYYI